MSTALVAVLARRGARQRDVPDHWVVGGLHPGILLVLLLALLAFGGGREHS